MPMPTAVVPEGGRQRAAERRMNDLFPIFVKLKGRRVLVVGGGKMAALRAKQLLRAGAAVTVVTPEANPEMESLAAAGAVELLRREFARGDLAKPCWMAIAATDDAEVQQAVSEEAERCGIFCNIVDHAGLSGFFTPAVVERGDLKIAISTSGRCPALAGKFRRLLEEAVPENAADLTAALGFLRTRLKLEIPSDLARQKRLVADFIKIVLKK